MKAQFTTSVDVDLLERARRVAYAGGYNLSALTSTALDTLIKAEEERLGDACKQVPPKHLHRGKREARIGIAA